MECEEDRTTVVGSETYDHGKSFEIVSMHVRARKCPYDDRYSITVGKERLHMLHKGPHGMV
jgi:hypothetical protein